MLVLSRKNQQSVVVGGAGSHEGLMKITVLDAGGGKVRLGFEGDADIPVYRFEVWERIQAVVPPEGPPAGPAAPIT
ncbi:MAG: carbon storage regulator [Pirellulales bacterium]